MADVLRVVCYGANVPADIVSDDDVAAILAELLAKLVAYGKSWSDVSLLILANSKRVDTPEAQASSDANLVAALTRFCIEQNWSPSFMGATVFASFFADGNDSNPDISDGLLFAAVLSSVLPSIPVATEDITRKADRRYIGSSAVQKAVKAYRLAMRDGYAVDLRPVEVFESATAVLFTSGSGHVEAREFIDFNECYALGQELLDKVDDARIVGGCASNRTANQYQALYFSDVAKNLVRYNFTYHAAAVSALLPYAASKFLLQHPYVLAVEDSKPLDIEFHERDQYAPGRNYYVRSINQRPPVEFLADYWDHSVEELRAMEANHTALPASPKTYGYTIASSISKFDKSIWPNVPVWFETVDGEVMLRLVRAEAEDSNYYLMTMQEDGVLGNARSLATYFDANVGQDSAVLSFLCESRKYLLNSLDSNAEADITLASMPDAGVKVGIYLNGEYAVGIRKAIGYHNFSHIAAIIPIRSEESLPSAIAAKIRGRESQVRTAVVLTALRVEHDAVKAYLTDKDDDIHPAGTIYTVGTFVSQGRRWRVATAEIGAGNDVAALEMERAVQRFSPEVALFVGVAGGLKDVSLGDVVVATEVYGYHSGKDGDHFQTRPDVGLSSYALVTRSKVEAASGEWKKRIVGIGADPNVVVAPIASGAVVVSSTRSPTYAFIRENYDRAVAVDMEGRGVLAALHANQNTKALVVRGVSDLLDGKEATDKAGWQTRAAAHAAAFAFEVLAKL